MTNRTLRSARSAAPSLALSLAVAGAGAAAATLLGLPAAVLVGGTAAVALAAMSGLSVSVPPAPRNVAFAALGVTLGAGATPDIAAEVSRWPLALLVLPFAMAAMTAASFCVFRLLAGVQAGPALLAASPGALSYVLALSDERGVDGRPVMVLQSLRLFLITTALPPIVAVVDGAGPLDGGPAPTAELGTAGMAGSLGLVAGAILLGWLFARWRVPAAWLFAGIAVSLPLHALGWVEGRPHPFVVVVAFLVVAALVGARFGAIGRREIASLLGAGALATVFSTAVAALFAWPVAHALALPFGQVWIAYAPGGVEAMAAIGLALGYDPVFVALHHIARLLLLAVALPLVIGARGPHA